MKIKWFTVSITYRSNGQEHTHTVDIESSTGDNAHGRVWAYILLEHTDAIFIRSTIVVL